MLVPSTESNCCHIHLRHEGVGVSNILITYQRMVGKQEDRNVSEKNNIFIPCNTEMQF